MNYSEELLTLIEAARGHEMTDEERLEQTISFVYGNIAIENPEITRESVRKVMEGRPRSP